MKKRAALAIDISRGGGRPWTASFLDFVLPLTPDEVLVVERNGKGTTPESRAEWNWIQSAQRLTWCYGAAEALRRLNCGAQLTPHQRPSA